MKTFSIPSYATVKDYCDSADRFPQIMGFQGDLKDVQRPWMIKKILELVPAGSKLLEIGSGEPLAANVLQKLGYDVTVIDPFDGSGNGPQAIKQYRLTYPKIKILQSYFEEGVPILGKKSFDCIFSISVLEHVPHENLQSVFKGVIQFLNPGGYSIHCTDLVVIGHTADWHDKGAQEIVYWQNKLQNPSISEDLLRKQVEDMFIKYYQDLLADIETYFHSAQGHNLWRAGLPYEMFPFRKIVSMQTCAVNKIEKS